MSAVADWRAGRISAEMAVARLALAGEFGAIAAEPALAGLAGRHGLDRLVAVRAAVDHSAAADPAAIGRMFDAAAAASPEASAAACSLGDAALLARATEEILSWLRSRRLLAAGADVLDLGCGIGRIAAAVAPFVRSVVGTDVSAGMVAVARRRCSAPNLHFVLTDGAGLACFAPAAVDLVLAVDCFPYLVRAGVAERHVAACARLLRPGGSLAVLNWSYRGLDIDRGEAARWAARHGFALRLAGAAPFTLWDGTAFLLEAAGPAGG